MFNQRIAALLFMAIGCAMAAAGVMLAFEIWGKTFSGNAEWLAFGVLFVLPMSVGIAIFAVYACAGLFVLAAALEAGSEIARWIAVALGFLALSLNPPYGITLAIVIVASVTVGWTKNLNPKMQRTFGIGRFSRERVAGENSGENSAQEAEPFPIQKYQICRKCGEKTLVDFSDDKSSLCSKCAFEK